MAATRSRKSGSKTAREEYSRTTTSRITREYSSHSQRRFAYRMRLTNASANGRCNNRHSARHECRACDENRNGAKLLIALRNPNFADSSPNAILRPEAALDGRHSEGALATEESHCGGDSSARNTRLRMTRVSDAGGFMPKQPQIRYNFACSHSYIL